MFLRTLTAAAVLLANAASAQADTTVVFNKYLPDRNEIMRTGLTPWAEAVEEKSGGSVKIEFTASSLAPPPRQLDMVRSGIADAAINLSSFTASQWLAPLIGELPLQFETGTTDARSIALWRTYDKYFREAEKLDGVHVVALWSLTGNHVWNNKRAVETLADAEGLKLRVNPNGTDSAVAMGGVVVSRPAIESYELITRGVVDGTLLPISSVEGLRLLEDLEYGTLIGDGMYRSTVSILFNENFWNDMPEEDRKAIEAASGEYIARLSGKNLEASEVEVRAKLEPSGIQITEMPAEQIAELKTRTAGAREKWAERVTALGLDPEEVLAYYREQIAAAGE
ncbi:TRAP transporter substrate-binding protein DctP [Pseudooceanicola sp. MF1-13]|uniref:TRAP transporter substrate-binding protein DctP n=1 Tax=Pseudooceanicola sp. MF1-13 TaxID=3379095 RepID=UPI003891772B